MPSTDTAPRTTYREFQPPPDTRAHVVCMWEQIVGAESAAPRQDVLPDACVDLVWIDDRPPYVAGPATRPVTVDLVPGARLRGVRLRPGMASAILHLSCETIRDRDVDLADCGRAFASKLRRLWGAGLFEALLDRATRPDRLVLAAVDRLARSPGVQVEQVARDFEISERQLNRRIRTAIGYGPKRLQRILRMQRLFALVASDRRSRAADLAHAAGFADQAHMSREVRALTGRAPSCVLPASATTLALSDLFKIDGAS